MRSVSFTRSRAFLTVGALVAAGLLVLSAPAAEADTQPTSGLPPTVSADALPTWQINGVVWSQTVVGNIVYVAGIFTKPGRRVWQWAGPER